MFLIKPSGACIFAFVVPQSTSSTSIFIIAVVMFSSDDEAGGGDAVGGEPVRTLPNRAERFPLAAVAGEDGEARHAPRSHLVRNQHNSVDQHRHHNFRIGA